MIRSPFGQYLAADGYELSSKSAGTTRAALTPDRAAIGCMEGFVPAIKDLPPPKLLGKCAAFFMARVSLFLPKLVTGEGACAPKVEKAFPQLDTQGISIVSRSWMSPTVMRFAHQTLGLCLTILSSLIYHVLPIRERGVMR